jgi:sigma-B regulation protein RsbU (phosphoserine phosphatase)
MDSSGDHSSPFPPPPLADRLEREDAAAGGPTEHLGAESSKLLRDILDSLTDGVVVADRDGRFVHFNPAAERILGLGPLGVPLSEWGPSYGCFREDGVTPFASEDLPLARALRGETTHDCELFIRNPRVTAGVWLSLNASPIRDEDGRIAGGVVVFRDVTAKRSELAHIELLSAVVEQTADSVVITDRDGLIEYVNPALEKTTGFSAKELVGKTPRAFRSGAHDNAFYDELWATLIAGRVFRGTLINRKKNGAVYYSEQTITPILDGSGTIVRFVSVGKDITDRRKAAENESRHLLARSVQQRLFPTAPPPGCGFELGGAVYTADKTGGDYFDYLQLPGTTTGLVVGDVSGHAFDAALVMAQTRAYLRSAAHVSADPGEILTRVNRVLTGDIPDNQFVTLVLACVNATSNTLGYASAGHTTSYVLERGGAVKCELRSTGIPLGVFADTVFETVTVPALAEHDLVVFFTDGVTEGENREGAPFGAARALEVVRRHCDEPVSKIVHHVYRAVRDFVGRREQNDDITVVVGRLGRCGDSSR